MSQADIYKTFVVSFRFAESATVGSLVISHDEGFESVNEAMLHFLHTTSKVMLGRDAHANSMMDLDAIEEYLTSLLGKSQDDWEIDDWEYFVEQGWTIPGSPEEGKMAFVDSLLHYGTTSMCEYHEIEVKNVYPPVKLEK